MQKICVLGMGYIGLPTSSLFAINGHDVVGVDVDESVVKTINSGNIHIEEPGLRAIVYASVSSGKLKASTTPENADVFIIAVPTPINKDKTADMRFVESATEAILPYLQEGNLVVLESTSPPKTVEELMLPILKKSGMEIGKQLFVAHCPERVLPGKILHELVQNHRVIGGYTKDCANKAKSLYSNVVEGDIHLTDCTTAEMCKLVENSFRDINIAYANELAVICEKLNIKVWELIKLANLHPRVDIHQPGPGVGGHCISVDPWFIVEKFPEEARIIHEARKRNDSRPHDVVNEIIKQLKNIKDPKVAVLGVAYKGNIDDCRESPAIEVIELLNKQGINVNVYDSHVKHFTQELCGLEEAFKDADLAVIIAPHDEFKHLFPGHLATLMKTRIIYDTRNMIDKNLWKSFGFLVVG